MKKTGKRWLAALLAVIMTVGVLPMSALADEPETGGTPSVVTDTEKSTETSGANLVKTAKYDPTTGKYTITLESWVTGSVETSSSSVPLDIVLVLDQSGSMSDRFTSTAEHYNRIPGNTKNKDYYNTYYNYYHNLWYKLDNGSYVEVTVTREWTGHHYKYTYTWAGQTDPVVSTGRDETPRATFYYKSTGTDISKLDALKTAANAFISAVAKDAQDKGVDHRIAVVGFASTKSKWSNNYNNTELLSTAQAVNYGSANNNDYKNALVSANAGGSVNTRLTNAIDRLSADGDTYSEYGIDMANKIFAQYPTEGTQRQRVVIMFTDGYTAPSGTGDFKYSMANNAIVNAKISKETYQAQVYTVGIFNDADPDLDINSGFKSDDGWRSGWGGEGNSLTDQEETIAANRYMHYVSSNYAGVSSLQDSAARVENSDYYLSAADSDALNNVFTSISSSVLKPNVEADGTTVVSDTLSKYFDFAGLNADGTLSGCIVKIMDYKGNDTWADSSDDTSGIEVKVTDKTVTATGFDYAKYPVIDGDPASGKKLVVTFEITPNADANWIEGTNDYPTNTTASMGKSDGSFATVPTSPELPVTAYKVSYKYEGTIPSGAAELPDPEIILAGTSVTVAPVPGSVEEDGYTYTFDGWYLDNAKAEGTITPTGSIELVGTWTRTANAANYKVEYYLQNLAGDDYDLDTDPTRTREVASTTDASVSETPAAIEGFTFDGTVEGTKTEGTVTADGSLILKLYYTRNSYEVSYAYTGDVHPTSEPAAPDTASYKYGETVTVADKVSADGYTFHGWYRGSDEVTSFTMPANDVKLTGYWTKDDVITEVTVTFVVVNGTWDEDGSTTKTVTVTLTNGEGKLGDVIPVSTPNTGYSNGKWDAPAPTAGTIITKPTTFTYRYSKLPTFVLGEDTDADFNIKKVLTTSGYVEDTFSETFTVNVTEYGYAELAGEFQRTSGTAPQFSGTTAAMTAAGTASFGNWTVVTATPAGSPYTFDAATGTLTFSKAGIYFFAVTEAEGGNTRMSYDSDEYGLAIAVKADEATGDLAVTKYTALANLYNNTINDFIKNYGDNSYTVNHEITIKNTYNGDPDTFAVKLGDYVKKTYTSTYGYTNTADFTFTATITKDEAIANSLTTEEAPKPATDLSKPINGSVRITTGETKDVDFGTIYLEEGTYFVEVSEVKGSLTDVEYDETVYRFTVTIELDGEGKAVVEYSNLMAGTANGGLTELERGAKAVFHNKYNYNSTVIIPPVPTTPDLNTEDHVAYLIGFTDGTIRPEANITRGEVATIFFRLLTDEARTQYWSQTNSYSDVPADLWCNNAISTLSNMGIINGYLDGTFRPSAPITRSELTKIAVSFFKYADINKFAYDGRFPDVKGDEWYVRYLAASVEFGLIEGDGNGMFRPNDPITRAETCTIVNRTLGRKPDAAHLLGYDVMITWPDNSNVNVWYYAAMQEATNSHDYTWITVNQEQKENWTAKLTERDWAALERMWSNANSAPGGEVMG